MATKLNLSYNGCLLLEEYYFRAWIPSILKLPWGKNYGYVHAKCQLSKGIKRTESDETSLKNWNHLGLKRNGFREKGRCLKKSHLCVREKPNR